MKPPVDGPADAVTGADGTFEITTPGAGTYLVIVERANFVDNAVRYESTLRFINGMGFPAKSSNCISVSFPVEL